MNVCHLPSTGDSADLRAEVHVCVDHDGRGHGVVNVRSLCRLQLQHRVDEVVELFGVARVDRL